MLGHGSRSIKDKMWREILDAFESENIEFAFPTYEVVGNTSVEPVGEAEKQSNVKQ
jgi:small-conductance mechanosensitive channel